MKSGQIIQSRQSNFQNPQKVLKLRNKIRDMRTVYTRTISHKMLEKIAQILSNVYFKAYSKVTFLQLLQLGLNSAKRIQSSTIKNGNEATLIYEVNLLVFISYVRVLQNDNEVQIKIIVQSVDYIISATYRTDSLTYKNTRSRL